MVDISLDKLARKSCGLLTENEVDGVGIGDVGKALLSLRCEEIALGALVLREKLVEGVIVVDVELIPLVEPCPLQGAVGNFEAAGADYVQSGTGYGAGAGDVARILRYFGVI